MKLLLALALFAQSALACIGGRNYAPENNLYIPDTGFQIQGITQTEFNEALDKVYDTYKAEIASKGGNLTIRRKWDDGTVNALAYREGSNFIIEMFGGLARHSAVTRDAFILVACHEIGHHIGGAPRYSAQGNTWASTEGQSDYFATAKCMRKVFDRDNNAQIVAGMNIDPKVKKDCEERHADVNDQDMCKRISMAGLASASIFVNNGAYPKFETPDPAVVSQTYESHPKAQCRLDTYFNGSVCDVPAETDFGSDPKTGACNFSAEKPFGHRPLCWFKPSGGGTVDPNPTGVAKTPTVNGQVTLTTRNPNQQLQFALDVREFSGVVGLAVEVSKPNKQFSNPNGTSTDQVNGMFAQVFQRTNGIYYLTPSKQLAGWGTYQIRVIALDKDTKPVSKNSNSFILTLQK